MTNEALGKAQLEDGTLSPRSASQETFLKQMHLQERGHYNEQHLQRYLWQLYVL